MKKIISYRFTLLVTFLIIFVLSIGFIASAKTFNYYIVSHGGPGDPFWGVVMKGMEDSTNFINKATDDTIKSTYSGPAKYSVEQLVDMINSAVAARPDGIAVTITDANAVEEPLRRAIEMGIPVIAINVPDHRPVGESIPYHFYIGADEYLAGEKAARRILEVKKPERAIVTIHEIGHKGLELRAEGFIDVMTEAGVPAEKLATLLDPTQAIEILKGYFSRHPETDTIFTVGSIPSEYVIDFLKEQDLIGKVTHGAFDVSNYTIEAIKEGITLFTISQQQYLQGYLPIHFLYLYNKYNFLPANDVLTGPGFIDAGNVESVVELAEKNYW